MISDASGIMTLERAVMREANEDARQILAGARSQIERAERQAQKETAQERKAILQRARREAESFSSHALATAELDAQSLRLRRREGLLDRVFAEAHERLPHLVERPDYRDVALALVREAVIRLNTAELLVRMDTATQRILTDATLDQVSREMGVELQAGDPLEHGVGVVVETPDGHRRYDNTLDSRLTEMQQPLRAPVYHLLMGEDL